MTDYSKMSDFEINKAVAEHEGVRGFNCENIGDASALRFQNWKELDYCNNPADAWPIIINNNISLHAPRLKEGWMADFVGSDEDVNDGFSVEYFEHHNSNPLRAAMIVFLMMKEAGNG